MRRIGRQVSPAQALLLSALRGRPATGDWEAALALAPATLLPYIADRLARAGAMTGLPRALNERLVTASRAATVAALRRKRALDTILRTLRDAGTQAVVLKGAALAHQVYPSPSLRQMLDIDVWVRRTGLETAAEALRRSGFRHPDRTTDGRTVPSAPGTAEYLALEIPGTNVLVDLHASVRSLRLLPPERVERMWRRATPAILGASPGTVLHPEDQLVHLCLHGALNGLAAGLQTLLDITLTVERWADRWNWDEMAADYRHNGIATWMHLTLHLSRDLLGAPVPAPLLETLQPPGGSEEMEDLALDQVWHHGVALPEALTHLAGDLTWHERTRWVLDRLKMYHWHEGPARGWWRESWAAARRLTFDIRTKLPRYLNLWRHGGADRPGMRQRLALARDRDRLTRLVADAEARRTDATIARDGGGG